MAFEGHANYMESPGDGGGRAQRRRWLWASLLAWVAVWAFWLAVTHRAHPTFALAIIVTTSLAVAYAAATYLNHLILIPRLWRTGRRARYAILLVAAMLALTALALTVIRLSYLVLWGPDPDPNGVYKHFAIDLSGMAAHVIAAVAILAVVEHAFETA